MKKVGFRTPRYYATIAGLTMFLLLTGFTYFWQAGSEANKDLVSVVVASKDIPAGSVLKEEMLKVEVRPKLYINKDSLKKESSVIGLKTSLPILKGEEMTSRKLELKSNDTGGLALMVSKGNRGFTILLDDSNPSGTILVPGNHVDVLATYDFEISGQSETETILEAKEVILLERSDKSGQCIATLLVAPKEAEKLAFAQANGCISLVLCPVGVVNEASYYSKQQEDKGDM